LFYAHNNEAEISGYWWGHAAGFAVALLGAALALLTSHR